MLHPLIRVKELLIFIKCKPVCHACNVVAYKALLACIFYSGIYMGRQEFWLYRVNLEKRLKYALCLICHPYHPVMLVKVSYKKFFKLSILLVHLMAETGYGFTYIPDIFSRGCLSLFYFLQYLCCKVCNLLVYYLDYCLRFVDFKVILWECFLYVIIIFLPEFHIIKLFHIKHLRRQSVIYIMVVICYLISHIHYLRLRAWARGMASGKSSFRFSALAIVLAIWLTSIVWVKRVL